MVRAAQDLDLADAGLRSGYLPEVAPRIASFTGDPSGPSWSAAVDRVMSAWVDAGELDGAERALDAMGGFISNLTSVTHLGMGTYHLMRARVAAARGDRESATSLSVQALGSFRLSDAPWWKAKAIRLLERTGAADQALVAEATHIERRLGAIRPTQ